MSGAADGHASGDGLPAPISGVRTGEAPRLVVTCGEPAGIGPEIAARAAGCGVPFTWIGDPRHLPAGTRWQAVEAPGTAVPDGVLALLAHRFAQPSVPGRPHPANAAGVVAVIERAVALVRHGAADGIVTAPIHKAALKAGAAFAFPGHTEFLAHLAGGCDVAMMLASTAVDPPCRVVPATIHIALADVPAALTPAVLERAVRLTEAGLRRDFRIARPRIAVAALNPHAGEGGAMGTEESAWIAALMTRLAAEGLAVSGPHPADTLFHAAARARHDAVVCAYHDQALIPIKTLDFSGGVNVTLGLPFVRTSPDHGTAFDIAGTGRADPASLIAALRMAADMVRARA